MTRHMGSTKCALAGSQRTRLDSRIGRVDSRVEMRRALAMLVWCGCSAEPATESVERAANVAGVSVVRTEAPAGTPLPLRVEFLGVGGFLLSRGDEQVMTPPLFTRPSLL